MRAKPHERLHTTAIPGAWQLSVFVMVVLMAALDCAADVDEAEARQRAQDRVQEAISMYHAEGRDAMLDHYNSAESIRDESYVFIFVRDGQGLANPLLPRDGLPRYVRTLVDAEGYNYGPDLLTATERGVWLTYAHENPATGEVGPKHTWLVLHEGLIFGSGWYD